MEKITTELAENPLLTAALDYAARGWRVCPLNGKIPLTAHGCKDATTDPETLRGWWAADPTANIGIATGQQSDLLVLDIDEGEGKCGLKTYRELIGQYGCINSVAVQTGGGGIHIYLKYPKDGRKWGNRTNFLPSLDIRGEAGYVVAPPSSHESGNSYQWIGKRGPDETAIADAPSWLLDLLSPKSTSKSAPPIDFRTPDTRLQRAAAYIAKCPGAIEGQGGDTQTFNLAGHLLAFGLNEAEVFDLMQAEWNSRCSPPWASDDLRKKISSAAVNGTARASKTDRQSSHDGRISGPQPLLNPPADDTDVLLTCLADVKAQALNWLWPDRFPLGKLVVLFGDPGCGKSLVALDCISRLATGRDWPDGSQGMVGESLIITNEDEPADTLVPRLQATGITADAMKNIYFLKAMRVRGADGKPGERMFTLNDIPQLEKKLHSRPNIKLVVIDPIADYLNGVDSHKDADIRQLLNPLGDLAKRTGVCLLLITHCNKGGKGGGGKAMYRSMGSIGFVGKARAAFLFSRDDKNNRRLMSPAKCNLAKDTLGMAYNIISVDVEIEGQMVSQGAIDWIGTTEITADEALAEGEPVGDPKKSDAKELIQEMLAAGEMSSEVILNRAADRGISRATVYRAKEELGVKVRKQGFNPTVWLWSLPPETGGDERAF